MRVSSQQQDLEYQRNKVVAQAIADGYTKNELVFVEGKESAIKLEDEERQTLAQLNNVIDTISTIESVYVFHIDRLSRRVSTILRIKDILLDKRINLVFLNPHKMATMRVNEQGNLVEDELTAMMLMFLSYGASMEMKTKQARIQGTKELMRAQNKVASGKVLFGYRKNPQTKEVEVDEQDGETVRWIFNEYINNGKTAIEIYNVLSAQGKLKVKGNSGARSTIMRVLKNKAYTGDYSSDDKIQNIKYPQIITKEDRDKVFSIIKSRTTGERQNKYLYFGKSIIRLTNNNKIMLAHATNLCYKMFENVKCSINVNAMDSIIWKSASNYYSIYKLMDLQRKPEIYKKEIEQAEDNISRINGEINKYKKQIGKLTDLLLDAKINDDIFTSRTNKINNIIKELNNQKANQQTIITKNQTLIDGIDKKTRFNAEDLNGLDDESKLEIIKEVIKEVQLTLNDDKSFTIKVIPINQVFDPFDAVYRYTCRGGKMKIYLKVKDKQEIDISHIIVNRIGGKKLIKDNTQTNVDEVFTSAEVVVD